MRRITFIAKSALTVLALGLVLVGSGRAQPSLTVTTPNYLYAVDGVTTTNTAGFFTNNSPPLTLVAGNTYMFTMEAASIHPMVIGTNFSTGTPPPSMFEYSNASPQDIFSGTLTLTIPATNFPTTLYYQCSVHGFYGVITIVPPPPPNQIVSIRVTTNIVLRSTGTSTVFTLVPQFSSNLFTGLWAPVASYTNTFANGTNVTVFDRLDPICGPNVFLRITQQPPNPL